MSSTISPIGVQTASAQRSQSEWALLARSAIGNGSAILFGLAFLFVGLFHAHLQSALQSLKGWDFFFFFCSSRLILEGHGGQIYDLHALHHIQALLMYPLRVRTGTMPNVFPPYWPLALAPLALLPYTVAYTVWLAVDCLLVAGLMFPLERYARLSHRAALRMRLGAIFSAPVFVALLQGQPSILIAAGLTASFFAARSDRDGVAGAALAVTLLKPQLAVPFLLVFALYRRWRALAAFATAGLSLLALPIPVLGASIHLSYAHTLFTAATWHDTFGFGAHGNHSFAGFWQLLLPGPVATGLTLGLDAVALLLLVRATLRAGSLDLPFGLAAVVALLISPHVLVHDLVLLVLPVFIALRHRELGPRHLAALLALTYAAVLIGFVLSFGASFQPSVIAMSALALWLFLASRNPVPVSLGPPAATDLRPLRRKVAFHE